jgi:hypothetical protein
LLGDPLPFLALPCLSVVLIMPCFCNSCNQSAEEDAAVMTCGFRYCRECYSAAVKMQPMIGRASSRNGLQHATIPECPGCGLAPMFPDECPGGGFYMTTAASLQRPHCILMYMGAISKATALQISKARAVTETWCRQRWAIEMENNIKNLREAVSYQNVP